MSRPLVTVAVAAFVVAGLVPIAVMLARVTGDDLASLFTLRIGGLLLRTLSFGGGVALFAVALGVPYAFVVARTDVPAAGALRLLGVVPLILPPLLLAVPLMAVFPWLEGRLAATTILGLSTFPLVGMFAARAFERVDARMEEAARLAGGLPALLRIQLRLAAPPVLAAACFAFVFAVNDFGIPDYVSFVNARFDPSAKFNVFADEIKLNWDQTRRPGLAVATSLPLIVLALAALAPSLSMRRRGSLAALTGDFKRPARLSLGAWRWPVFALALAPILIAVALPIVRFLWQGCGLHKTWDGADPGGSLSLGLTTLGESFGVAMDKARVDLANSVKFASAAAAVSVALALVLGHALERARRGRTALALACLLPVAAPALLFGIGAIATWNHPATASFYDGGGLVVLLQTGRFAPFAILIVTGAVASLDPTLEESAALAGAGPARRLGSIVAPAIGGALAAAFVVVFVLALRDLDSAIVVPAANKTAVHRVFNMVHFSRDEEVAVLSLLIITAVVLPGALWAAITGRRLEVLP